MERAIVVQGRLSDPQHIELDEPVTEVQGPVEVVVRAAASAHGQRHQDVFDLIARLPAGTRSKEDIDRQVREERESWGDR